MKDPFDRERLAEASHRKKCAKHKGRNHWRNWERRQMQAQRQAQGKIAAAIQLAKRRRFLARARAYWRGESDNHP